jgi:hypothetical protein
VEVNPKKTKYMLKLYCKKKGQNHIIKIANGPLKVWQSSNIWEHHQQIKITYTKRLRADYIQGILATIWFSLLSSSLLSRNIKVKILKTIILAVFCMGAKLGLSR